MKKIIAICVILASISLAQAKEFELYIVAKNDLGKTMQAPLSFGISENASDVLDPELGESMLPPPPFVGFHAAFEFIDSSQIDDDGSIYYDKIWTNKDIRNCPVDETELFVKYKMIFRFGGGSKVLLNWNKFVIPEWVDSLFIRDPLDGLVLERNMKEVDTLSWDNDGLQTLYIHAYYKLKSTSVEDNKVENNYKIFPNPSSDYFKVDNEFDKLELIDMLGNVLITENNSMINIKNIPIGLYFVKIYSGSQVSIQKLIKSN